MAQFGTCVDDNVPAKDCSKRTISTSDRVDNLHSAQQQIGLTVEE